MYMNLLLLSICSITTVTNGFGLLKPLNPSRKTTQLFDRLKYHEIITIKNHNFYDIDNGEIPIYPTNGTLEFYAFGRDYKLLLHKNTQLFSPNFYTEKHRFTKKSVHIEKERIYETPQCHYTQYTAVHLSKSPSNTSQAALSLCNGRGIHGWIHSFGETVVIRPKLYLMDVTYNGEYKINDQHIIYKYTDLNRTAFDNYFDSNVIMDEHTNYNIGAVNVRRNMQSQNDSTIRWVELAIVNDPAMITEYESDYEALLTKTISIISTVQSRYFHTDWGTYVGQIKIVLTAVYFVESWDTQYEPDPYNNCQYGLSVFDSSPPTQYCEVSYADYLYKFQNYFENEIKGADNAQLFSFYDFGSSVLDYASLPGMCLGKKSVGINQVTFDDEYNGNIVAHAMGHNFNMQHDGGTGNGCDNSEYIMASVGSPYGYRPTAFSTCSITFMDNFFRSITYMDNLRCLDNEPSQSVYSNCGNGIIEEGEICDCGQTDCSSIDICCDGSSCQLQSFAECSHIIDPICCSNCQIIRAEYWLNTPTGQGNEGIICRELNPDNSCDIEAEYCDGISSKCPTDTFSIEGTQCLFDDHIGYCYNGECISVLKQCQDANSSFTDSDGGNDVCNETPLDWQIRNCNVSIKCEHMLNSNCYDSLELPEAGTPCNLNDSLPAQCLDFECKYSSTMYTYGWKTNQWRNCSIPCKFNENDTAGNQSRTIDCILQNGVVINNESLCTDTKPISIQSCNDFICNFTVFTTTNYDEIDDEIKVNIDTASLFFKMLLAAGGLAIIIIIYSFLYICCFSALIKRTMEPGTASIFRTLRLLGICNLIGLTLEISDIVTDYLYAVDLITQTNEDIIRLGWVSLFSAIIGLILFGIKILLTNKLRGYQEYNLKQKLKSLPRKSEKAKEIMTQIRVRHMDVATIGLLISCFEDIPQAMIVVIVVKSNEVWNVISILNFALAVISFLWKCVQVLASKLGCNDPSDVLRVRSKAELELAENTKNQQMEQNQQMEENQANNNNTYI